MTDKNDLTGLREERPLSWLGWTVDVGFVALIVACALRYYTVHPFAGRGVVVLVLALGSCLAYLIAVAGSSNAALKRAGVLTATGLWFPLVLLAPSFGWTAFALFFTVHRALPRRAARWLSAAIVVAVSAGMFLLSNGQDLGLMFGPLLGGIVLSVVYVQLDRVLENRRRLIDQLVATQQQLAQSEREAGALTERTRVASELHDTVAQQTATALLLLEANGSEHPQIQEARDVLREALTETRQLMAGLTNPRPTGGSLIIALTELAPTHDASFVVAGEERALPDEVAHALLRVCQEALTNVGKHANAENVSLTLTFFADAVGVSITDDGTGFELSAATEHGQALDDSRTGYGLRAMAWRVENLGGSFQIESTPREGTVVSVIVPDLPDPPQVSTHEDAHGGIA